MAGGNAATRGAPARGDESNYRRLYPALSRIGGLLDQDAAVGGCQNSERPFDGNLDRGRATAVGSGSSAGARKDNSGRRRPACCNGEEEAEAGAQTCAQSSSRRFHLYPSFAIKISAAGPCFGLQSRSRVAPKEHPNLSLYPPREICGSPGTEVAGAGV